MKKIISLILAFAMIFTLSLALASCGGRDACAHLEERDVTGRDIHFVEMSVKDCGKMVILLDATTAPITVANFLSLVKSGFYDGLTFHRIMEGFMIQGGDPDGDGRGGSDTAIKGEFAENGHYNDIPHIEGVISMARTGGNEFNNYGYDTATSQFFICNDDAREALDGKYAAFGYVVKGLNVVHKITELGMPKTDYYEYYETNRQIWQYYGNGAISNKADQPVIEYIKVLEDYKI